jgi:hypothetical protein
MRHAKALKYKNFAHLEHNVSYTTLSPLSLITYPCIALAFNQHNSAFLKNFVSASRTRKSQGGESCGCFSRPQTPKGALL